MKTLDELTAEDWGRLFPIEISSHNAEWAAIFNKEKARLEEALAGVNPVRVEHFGSTAVPGLPAKDTIDILIEIPPEDLFSLEIIRRMGEIGYHYFLQKGSEPDYMVFAKGYNLRGDKEQTYHVHMSAAEHSIWDRIYFRDYLRENAEVAQAYARLKYDLAQQYGNRRVEYRMAKTDFVKG